MDCWDNIPWEGLPKSVMVDLGRYLLKHKDALRFHLDSPVDATFRNMNISGFLRVFKGMVYIARTPLILAKLVHTDNDNFPHELSLGKILGYPVCCVEKIRIIGENFIDDYNNEFNREVEKHSLLDISLYSSGLGLISHVPCSTSCEPSMRQAYEFYQSLKDAIGSQKFCVWRDDTLDYFELKN